MHFHWPRFVYMGFTFCSCSKGKLIGYDQDNSSSIMLQNASTYKTS